MLIGLALHLRLFSAARRAMQLGYRFWFFDTDDPIVVAVFVLHYPDDASAEAEADALLAVSKHFRIEVWQGTRKVYTRSKVLPRDYQSGPSKSQHGAQR